MQKTKSYQIYILNDLAPASFGSMIQHSRLVDTRLLHQSSRTTSFFNSMFISLPRLWDEIPSNLHTITNLSSFKSGCKKHFMSFLDWVPYCMYLFYSDLLAWLCFDYLMYKFCSIVVVVVIIIIIIIILLLLLSWWWWLWLWLMLFVFNWIREHHGDWASSPFSYPELLAYL